MILVVAAMPEEYKALEEYLMNARAGRVLGVNYHIGMIDEKEVMLMLSGVGKVNATYSLTTILNNFDIDFIVNIGSAGGVLNEHHVDVLDIVVAKCVVQHDVDLVLANRKKGELPNLPQYYESALNEEIYKNIEESGLKFHCATIASGDQFVGDLETVQRIVNDFDDVCAIEMEAGAIAQVAYLNKIPFIVLRSISDVVGASLSNQLQFEEYIKQASINSAKISEMIIRSL